MAVAVFKRMALGFGIVAVLFFALAFFNFRFFQEFEAHSLWVSHAHEVRSHVESLRATLYQSESARRGYVITGEDERLKEFGAAERQIMEEMSALRTLTADNASQQKRLDEIQPLLKSHTEFSDRVMDARKLNPEEAVRITLTNRGVELMREIQNLIGEMNREEKHLLITRTESVRASFNRLVIVYVLFGLFILLVLALLGYLLWRNLRFSFRAFRHFEKVHETFNGGTLKANDVEKVKSELDALGKNIQATIGLMER